MNGIKYVAIDCATSKLFKLIKSANYNWTWPMSEMVLGPRKWIKSGLF